MPVTALCFPTFVLLAAHPRVSVDVGFFMVYDEITSPWAQKLNRREFGLGLGGTYKVTYVASFSIRWTRSIFYV